MWKKLLTAIQKYGIFAHKDIKRQDVPYDELKRRLDKIQRDLSFLRALKGLDNAQDNKNRKKSGEKTL